MNEKKVVAVLFAIVLVALPIATLFSKKATFSESENRNLASLPNFSTDAVMDKTFMNGFDAYISDHFFGRDFWVQAKSNMELFTLKKENNSILLTTNNTLVKELEKPDEAVLKRNIHGIQTFAKNNPDSQIYTAIAPTSCGIYSDILPYGKKVWNQQDVISSFYKDIESVSYNIDLFSTLVSCKEEYIYYKTDHHWTSLGAYYAYKQISNALGFTPYALQSFDTEHHNDFYGTYSSESNIKTEPDTIDIYSLAKAEDHITEVIVNNGTEEKIYDSIYFRDFLTKKDKYSVFLGQVQPEITVKTNVKNNKKLLVFKDSFAHSLIPFLSLHYSEIKIIDLRWTSLSYKEYANISDYESVLLMYNIESILSTQSLPKLAE